MQNLLIDVGAQIGNIFVGLYEQSGIYLEGGAIFPWENYVMLLVPSY